MQRWRTELHNRERERERHTHIQQTRGCRGNGSTSKGKRSRQGHDKIIHGSSTQRKRTKNNKQANKQTNKQIMRGRDRVLFSCISFLQKSRKGFGSLC